MGAESPRSAPGTGRLVHSSVPARCAFCSEWTARTSTGDWPTHCRCCDEPFWPVALTGLPKITERLERAR